MECGVTPHTFLCETSVCSVVLCTGALLYGAHDAVMANDCAMCFYHTMSECDLCNVVYTQCDAAVRWCVGKGRVVYDFAVRDY